MAEDGLEARKETIRLPNTFETWPGVSEILRNICEGKVRSVEEFQDVYPKLEFTTKRHGDPKFASLRRVLRDADYITDRHFFDTLLPWIARKALDVDQLFNSRGHELQLLRQQMQCEVVLTRLQVCCILSLAFFALFPPPDGPFQHLLLTHFIESNFAKSQRTKLLCVLTYFDRIRHAEGERDQEFLSLNVSIQRRAIEKQEPGVFWGKCELLLRPFSCEEEGLIEDSHGDLQVDFANEYIGGGVVILGNVQEEIHFCINPECLVSLLLCERMEDNEAILIQGAEQFSQYSGYGFAFTFAGPYTDTNPIDDQKRRCVSIVAIDATPQGYADQDEFSEDSLVRELDKAYCGFSFRISGDGLDKLRAVATGNWGCGAFGGSKEMKTLLQWMAASRAGRPLKYFSFRDRSFSKNQAKIVALLQEKRVTVGQLYNILVASSPELSEKGVFASVQEKVCSK